MPRYEYPFRVSEYEIMNDLLFIKGLVDERPNVDYEPARDMARRQARYMLAAPDLAAVLQDILQQPELRREMARLFPELLQQAGQVLMKLVGEGGGS